MTPRQFWDWFGVQRERMCWPPPQDLQDDIAARLHDIHVGLGFELAKAVPPVLAISASGDAELFELVREIVRCAPVFSFVQIVAFRQRGPIAGFRVRCLEGGALSDDDLWFRLVVSLTKVGLFVFVRNFPAERFGHIQEDAYLLLDNALGEEDMVTCIDWIEWGPLPPDPLRVGLQPLVALPRLFDDALGRPPHV